MSKPRHSMEIACRECRQVALARAEPVYDGFRKVGELFVCTACGARYASRAETPLVSAAAAPRVFSEADRPDAPQVFRESERQRCCGWCIHRVVNPFGQRCGQTNQEVESTDLCDRFERRSETDEASASPPVRADPLSKLFGD